MAEGTEGQKDQPFNGGVHVGSEPAKDPNEGQQTQPWSELGVTQEQYEKFYDAKTEQYNWQAHAKEAEFKAQQAAKRTEPAKADAPESGDKAPASDAAAQKAVTDAGLDWSKLESEVTETGGLTAESRKALNDAGIADPVIDQYIAGLENTAVMMYAQVMDKLGGEDGIQKIKQNLDQQGIDQQTRSDFEKRLAQPDTWREAADELLALAKVTPGSPAQPGTAPATAPQSGVQPFASENDMLTAMRDPRYRERSPRGNSYRAEVQQRIKAGHQQGQQTSWMQPRAHTVGF